MILVDPACLEEAKKACRAGMSIRKAMKNLRLKSHRQGCIGAL